MKLFLSLSILHKHINWTGKAQCYNPSCILAGRPALKVRDQDWLAGISLVIWGDLWLWQDEQAKLHIRTMNVYM